MARVLAALWVVLLAGLLVGAGLLGFAAARGDADPGLHAAAGVLAAALAIGSHVRRGGGWDFLAVLLLLAAVGLGAMLDGAGVATTLHLGLAVLATLLSVGLHLSGLAALRSAVRERPG